MRKPKYEVYYGGLSSGKSSYAQSKVDPKETLVVGTGSQILDWVYLRPGATKRHITEITEAGFESRQNANPSRIADLCRDIEKPVLLIDDWATLFRDSIFWPMEKIKETCHDCFSAINSNNNLERAIFVVWDSQIWLPFGLYKKRALWNKELFKVADEITRLDYGIPLRIK